MRYLSKLTLLAALGAFLFGMTSNVAAQGVSRCNGALGEAFLDVNNVRAKILNNGGLFWGGGDAVYEVPKGGGVNAIFNSGIWITGQVDGQLRAAAAMYKDWEFWAGPLDDQGNAPFDCDVYDRVYKVSKTDVEDLELFGSSSNPDLANWPTGLGAPTLDANGDLVSILDQPLNSRVDRVINVGAGERPAILGDQTIWWVMNDRGNQHTTTDAPAIGLEVHGTAFAFDVAGDLGNTTFYKYRIFYKGNVPLENSYLTIWSDPDLGNFNDDYVGSDSTLGLGYVYNSDNVDEGVGGYGTPVPAAGYDFLQGPIVPSVGDTAFVSGERKLGFKNLGMTTFLYWANETSAQSGPVTTEDYYDYVRGFWRGGEHLTEGGSGLGFSTINTNFAYSGDPATQSFWTEVNSDGLGTAIRPDDRRFLMSTGPITFNPGNVQEIVFGLVWAVGTDNLDSVAELRKADIVVQDAFDAGSIVGGFVGCNSGQNASVAELRKADIVIQDAFDAGSIVGCNSRPTASFATSATTGQTPFEITFNGSNSSDPDGDPLAYAWDFGDGGTGTGNIVSHTFTLSGAFVVSLTVSDGSLSDSASKTIEIASGVDVESIDVPTSFTLYQNYPNPFNPVTTISFDLPGTADVTLAVYNVLGREVARLVDKRLSAASYRVTWDASGMPSGLYHYKLVAGSFMETKSMVLLK